MPERSGPCVTDFAPFRWLTLPPYSHPWIAPERPAILPEAMGYAEYTVPLSVQRWAAGGAVGVALAFGAALPHDELGVGGGAIPLQQAESLSPPKPDAGAGTATISYQRAAPGYIEAPPQGPIDPVR